MTFQRKKRTASVVPCNNVFKSSRFEQQLLTFNYNKVSKLIADEAKPWPTTIAYLLQFISIVSAWIKSHCELHSISIAARIGGSTVCTIQGKAAQQFSWTWYNDYYRYCFYFVPGVKKLSLNVRLFSLSIYGSCHRLFLRDHLISHSRDAQRYTKKKKNRQRTFEQCIT